MHTSEGAMEPAKASSDGRLVLRNTAYLSIAEVLSVPTSVLLSAMLGRYLGPVDLGHIYLASTIAAVAILVVGWGHSGTLPAAVAIDRQSSGTLLGSSVAWRVSAAIVTYAIVALGCSWFGFTSQQQWAVGLVFLATAVGCIMGAFQDVIRGFERTDVAAYSRVGSQLVATLVVIPVLIAGGRMRLALLAQAFAGVVVMFAVVRVLKPIGVGKLGWDRAAFKKLMIDGTPFVFFQLALVLQPNIGAFYLNKLTPPEAMGWYSVSQRLVGFLLVPATALIGALYPTLCRLHATDQAGFRSTSRMSISSVSLVVVPVALGCALYPDIGVSIFGRGAFAPAEDILRVFALDMFLIYFTMPIGTILLASGFQRVWSMVQLVCVGTSAILDPLLIKYFQARTGNGATGLALADTLTELVMVAIGIALMPKGVFDRVLAKTLALAFLSGVAMVGVAFALRGLPSLAAAPFAVIAYGLALYFSGGISKEQAASLTAAVRRKLNKRAS